MAEFDLKVAEFTEALDRLEEAARPLLELRARASRDAVEIATLKEEREQLLARIAALEEQARTLAGVSDEVEGRLDDAITEIRSALAR